MKKMPTTQKTPAEPLLLCPHCKLEMRLLGIEPDKPGYDLFTFECTKCGRFEARSALLS
jgi:hypothetical protein